MLSVIIPTAGEIENIFFTKTLSMLAAFTEVEVICIDRASAKTRAERLNQGFAKAKGSMILFYHPRSLLDPKGIQYLVQNSEIVFWGAFTHAFDVIHPLLRFTSWYSNKIRGKINGIFYLDHCIFFHRTLWKENLPAIEIFEDTVLSQILKNQIQPVLLPYLSTTSAVRFTKNGVWTQAFMNQVLKIGFHLHVPHAIMNRVYEKGLNLNSKR